ncbi:OmpA family protein [Aureispira anguillae]|uniref:OmpA family protein n=1 Tax=Aureispira anguillae TaxID=2864201 RepID=A0A916DVQ2_9BACT|nr:OmpA family protein [Aureispira anguillae]BDS13331.1 OmpA family protein [Aureispira anguillae]
MMTKFLVIISLLFCLTTWGQDTLVLDEKFDKNELNWYEKDTKTIQTEIRDGHYYIKSKTGKSFWISKQLEHLNPNLEDFTIEVKLRQVAGSLGMGLGLFVALNEDNSAYKKFLINGSGQYKVDHFYDKKSHILANYKEHKTIAKGFEYNVLRVTKRANTVAYYINGNMIGRSAQNNFYGNRIAFFLGGKMAIEIDYIKVNKHPSALDIVENAEQVGERVKLGPAINSNYSELSPIISADGQTMYVCRSGHPDNIAGNDIWVTTLNEDKEWSKLKNIGYPLNNEGHNFVVSVAPDNNSLILANRYRADGTAGSNGLSISYRTAQGWSIPEALEIDNFYNNDKFVAYFLCADNKTLILSVQRKDSYGHKDLYVSFRKENGIWSVPLNMGKQINSFENEVNPFVAADGKTLYFASQGHPGYGHHDLFVAKRLDETWTNWTKPQNLGPKINTPYNDFSFYLDAEGEYAYLGSKGDIWRIENPEKPEPIVLIKGRVFNAKTKEPMSALIEYQDLLAKNKLGNATSDPVSGAYQIVLPAGKKYGYQAAKNGFYAVSNFVDLVHLEKYGEKNIDIYLTPIEKGEVVRLNNIFFEFNKAIFKQESYAELERLYYLMEQQQELKIEISGHTDDKGGADYNLELSQKRANAVMQYLLDKGINADRLQAVGYGEQKPLLKNSSDSNRSINRRVEFKVL